MSFVSERKKNRRIHSWALWKTLGDNIETVLTGLSTSTFNLQELDDCSREKWRDSLDVLEQVEQEGEIPFGRIFPLELVVGSERRNSFFW